MNHRLSHSSHRLWQVKRVSSRWVSNQRIASNTLPSNPIIQPSPPLINSQVSGPTTPPLFHLTLPQYFSDIILQSPGFAGTNTALISRHEPVSKFTSGPRQRDASTHVYWSFDEMDVRVEALSHGLMDLGIEKGDRVAVVMGNCSAYALLQWACARIGAVLVTINPAYKIHEIVNNLNLTGVKALVTVPQLRSSRYLEALLSALPLLSSYYPNSINDAALPSLRSLIVVDNAETEDGFRKEVKDIRSAIDFRDIFRWDNAMQKRRLDDVTKSLSHHDVINLQFTSGTTGAPKAVSLTHHNLLNNGYFIGSCMNISSVDRICNVPPLFHCFDETHGAGIVYASETFNPRAVLESLSEEKCTGVHGVPTHFLGLLKEIEKDQQACVTRDLSRLRTGIAAGSPIPNELMRQLINQLNLRDLSIAYGMTETSPVSFQTNTEDPLIKKIETVGKVQPHVHAKLIDEEGKVVPIDTPGELCVRGYLVQKGYWNDPEQTASVWKADPNDPKIMWMHTGDVAIMDKDGYLRIVGRNKDIIIRGGENLFPVQIENAITTHPCINEAAVVAVPDPTYGEVVGVWIARQQGKPAIGRDEVRKHVAATMNPQNAPAWVFFLGEDGVQEELPKTASGKVMKNVLRDWSRSLVQIRVGAISGE